MFEWLKNIFSHKTDTTDDNLVEKRQEEHKTDPEKQDLYPHGPSSENEDKKE